MAKKGGRESPTGGRAFGHATTAQLDRRPVIKYQHGYAQVTAKSPEEAIAIIRDKGWTNPTVEVGLHDASTNRVHFTYGTARYEGEKTGMDLDYLERIAARNDRSIVEQVQFDSKIGQIQEVPFSPDRVVFRVRYDRE